MENYKKSLSGIPYKWVCLSALLLCACAQVSEHCSDGNQNRLDPATQFCYGGAPVYKCGGMEYNPPTQGCDNGTVKNKCTDGSFAPCSGGTDPCEANPNLPQCQTDLCATNPNLPQCQSGGGGNGLVLGNGEAWVSGDSGYIFTSNYRAFKIFKSGGSWWYDDTTIYLTTGNDVITINNNAGTYSISGNALSLSICACTLIKTSGISPKIFPNPFVDGRDNQSYKWVKIGNQIWMAQNLNHAISNSVCYGNQPYYCTTYGRLYNWYDAMIACPIGWHLPTDAEWDVLMVAVGGVQNDYSWLNAATKLKSKTGWDVDYDNYNHNGTDNYGFSALPGGSGYSDGSFGSAGYHGGWWSATESNASYAWYRNVDYDNENVGRYDDSKSNLFSVRCVRD